MGNIVEVDKDNIDDDLILKAVRVLKRGKLIIFPTNSLYGIGADACNSDAVKKIFEIKKRSFSMPLLILIEDRKSLDGLVAGIPDSAEMLMEKFWPGNLTIIFGASKFINSALTSNMKIGIRLPGHPIAAAITRSAGFPITGTSANISGMPGISEIKDMSREFRENFDMIIDGGRLRGGKGSTVVDVTDKDGDIKILREGSVSAERIRALFRF